MSKSAGAEELSLQLQETIEKLENILSQIQNQKDFPSSALVKRLVVTTEAIERSIDKRKAVKSLWKKISIGLVAILVIAGIGVGVYFLKPSLITKEVTAQSTPAGELENTLSSNIPFEEKIPPSETLTEETVSEVTETEAKTDTTLTPEQSFLAGVQKSITSLSNKLQLDLIDSVKVDFDSSSLRVKINSAWYDLTPNQQNNLAQDIWGNSQSLAWAKLELVNLQDEVIARSPVVGHKMIILQRSNQTSIP